VTQRSHEVVAESGNPHPRVRAPRSEHARAPTDGTCPASPSVRSPLPHSASISAAVSD